MNDSTHSDGDGRDTALEFPCEFPIKVMGRDTESFRSTATAIVERHYETLPDGAVRESASRNGRFVSLTLTITATSQRQLDNIYEELTAHEEVLVAL